MSYGTGGGGQGVPYSQSYSYDEYGNTTGRSGVYYSYNNNPYTFDSASYPNNDNRRSGWSYNADGLVTASPLSSTDRPRNMSYDAAGRLVTSTEFGQFNTTTYSAGYDGDGQLMYESSNTSSVTTTSYIVRSTALGGEVLTRLDQSGNKKTTHVSAEGLLFCYAEYSWRRLCPGNLPQSTGDYRDLDHRKAGQSLMGPYQVLQSLPCGV